MSAPALEIAPRVSAGTRALQAAFCCAGAVVILFPAVDARLRCFTVSIGAGLLLLGIALAGRWRRCAAWAALALAGQAASLQLIDAGQLIHYQHYRPLRDVLRNHPLALLLLIAQAALVISGGHRQLGAAWNWLRGRLRWWTIPPMVAAVWLPAAALSRDPRFYLAELCFAGVVQLVSLGNILLVAGSVPRDAFPWLRRFFTGEQCVPLRKDKFLLCAALWVAVVAALLSYFVYERHPHIPDEVTYFYHARYLAAGHLTLPAPPVPEAFRMFLMAEDGARRFVASPPGWPALLALGFLLGAPWLVNPLLGGVNVLLSYFLLRALFGSRNARLGVLLLCASPWHVFMAMNFMTHTFAQTCALAAALALIRARDTGKTIWGATAGAAIGMTGLIRPLDGLVLAVLLGLWAIGVGGRRLKIRPLAAFALATVLVTAATLPYNAHLTGSPWKHPLTAYMDKKFGPGRNDLGFGPNRGPDGWTGVDPLPGHGPLDVLINASLNAFSTNIELFGWGAGSLLLAALFLFAGSPGRQDYLMLAVMAVVFLAFSLYWYSGGPDFGARYWYLTLLPLVALSVRGIRLLEAEVGSTRVLAGVIVSCGLALLNYFPWRAVDKYYRYERMRPDIRELAQKSDLRDSLVLIRGAWHPDYASAWVYNPLTFDGPAPVFASLEKPELREQLVRAFPGRKIRVVDGPTVSGGGFRMVAQE